MGADKCNNSLFDDDAAQIAALKAGSTVVWRKILDRYGVQLLAYAVRMLGDKATAEDVVQDSLVNIYQTIDRFDGRCSLKSWLYRGVHNRAIDEIRRRKRYVDVGEKAMENHFNAAGRWLHDCPGWDGLAAKQLDDRRLLEVVGEEIACLPHAHREVLLLREVEGLESDEICNALDISLGNLRIRIHRARAALRDAVVQKMGGVKS